MSSPRVDLSERAKGDLRDTEAWIAEHDDEMRAAAVVERILDGRRDPGTVLKKKKSRR